VFESLAEVTALKERLAELGEVVSSEAGFIDLIRGLEELKAAAAAAQAEATVRFDRMRHNREALDGIPERRRGRGVAAEVALARRESPHRGGRLLGLARALDAELPHTRRALQKGLIGEWQATLICRETACLSATDRMAVDALLGADAGKTQGWGDRQLVAQARRHALALDAESVVRRAARAVADRRVSCRPAPDTMCRLSALLPVAHGVAVYAALSKEADRLRAAGDQRSRGQLMADLLVERVTGVAAGTGRPVEVNLVLTDRALFSGEGEPAHLDGYGTIPAAVARGLVKDAARGLGAWFRTLYTHPVTGALIAMTSKSRTAPKGLADFLDIRDQTCRTPWCDAPIRHHDHVWAAAAGGATDAENLQGLCEACNYAKQAPGWRSHARTGWRHLVITKTPTGHVYESQAPPPVGHEPSTGEFYTLTNQHAEIDLDSYRRARDRGATRSA
jgi:hypothetical protein